MTKGTDQGAISVRALRRDQQFVAAGLSQPWAKSA